MTRSTSCRLIGTLALLGSVLSACEARNEATEPVQSFPFAASVGANADAKQFAETCPARCHCRFAGAGRGGVRAPGRWTHVRPSHLRQSADVDFRTLGSMYRMRG